jgi:hypothetical protein
MHSEIIVSFLISLKLELISFKCLVKDFKSVFIIKINSSTHLNDYIICMQGIEFYSTIVH